MMLVDNNSPAAGSRALNLRCEPGRAPMMVNADAGKAVNLNADRLDGKEADELADPRGYAHVADEGAVDPAYPSKGVNGVVIPAGATGLYCFDLDFTPHAAVASPFFTNSAVVATVTPPNPGLASACPDTHRDAAARVFASESGSEVAINFHILFV